MTFKKEQFTPKKIVIGLIPIVIIILIIIMCNNGQSELSCPKSLNKDCYNMAMSEIEYAQKFINNKITANDAYTSINLLCDDSILDSYYDEPENSVYEKISDLKLAIKYSMYAENTGKSINETTSNVEKSITELKNTISKIE